MRSVSPEYFIGAWIRPVIFEAVPKDFQTVTAGGCVVVSRRKQGAARGNPGRAFSIMI
jgi:hypothetical protein